MVDERDLVFEKMAIAVGGFRFGCFILWIIHRILLLSDLRSGVGSVSCTSSTQVRIR